MEVCAHLATGRKSLSTRFLGVPALPAFVPIPPDGLTIAQAHAELPWLSVRALRGLREKRIIPTWIVCGHVVFSRADLEALPVYSPPITDYIAA